EPRSEREDDGVPEVAADVHARPGLAEVAPGEAVPEERQRMRDRVVRRRDRRLGEPEDRAEPRDDQQDEQQRLRPADAPADAGTLPVGAREQRALAGLDPGTATEPERDHLLLQERVARRYTSEKSARKTASIRLSAVALP